jgi:muramidase (phage lysozyme)
MATKVTRSINYMNEPNVKAFLKLIRYCEHGRREDDRVYFTLYGGGTFTDASSHPLPESKAIRDRHGKPHSPAGAFQIIYKTWKGLKDQGYVSDFTPYSQDMCAIRIIQNCSAMNDLMKGNIGKVLHNHMIRGQWAALPGATQQKIGTDEALGKFHQYVKEYSKK